MSEKSRRNARARREPVGTRLGLIAGLSALLSVIAVGISIYGMLQKSATAAPEIRLPYMIAAGGGIVIAAVIAQFRNMSAGHILEAMWETVCALFGLVGAMLRGIWSWFLGLLGLD
jgi:hypothetical protein